MFRYYQQELSDSIDASWNSNNKNVLAVSPTGSGKTVLFSGKLKAHNGASCVMAHRNSLVTQISRALNKNEVPHRLIAQPAVIRECVKLHEQETGRSFYHPQAPCAAASVKTLLSQQDNLRQWRTQVTKWVTDEAHHLLADNEWGKATALFDNAQGLGVTATPLRADGNGLGRHASGVFDDMVMGYSQRYMLLDGWLTPFDIVSVPSDIDLTKLKRGKNGDFTLPTLKKAEEGSHLVGDVVQEYLKHARGKLGVTFASSIETATDIVAEFNKHGVPAVLVSADTPNLERFAIERRFKNRDILQLVNVDLFGEGYDLPELEVISMARKTDSFSLFVQQAGRVLRPVYADYYPTSTRDQRVAAIAAGGKPRAMIIDHVSNVKRHARARYCDYTGELYIDLCHANWSMDATERRSVRDPELIPSMTCAECAGEFPGTLRKCPYCEDDNEPTKRGSIVEVDGDLELLTPEALFAMTEAINKASRSPSEVEQAMRDQGMSPIIAKRNANLQADKLGVYADLGKAIDWWGGFMRAKGRADHESFRLFYYRFGIDILSARALSTREAITLNEAIRKYLLDHFVKPV